MKEDVSKDARDSKLQHRYEPSKMAAHADSHGLHCFYGPNSSLSNGDECELGSISWTHQCKALLDTLDNQGKPDKKVQPTSIVFLKTHKTGSSTVQNILLRHGASRKLTFALPMEGNHFRCPRGMPNVLSPCWTGGKADILTLHTDCSVSDIQQDFIKDEAFWFTILRQPDLLFESLYRYCDMHKKRMYGVPFEVFLEHPPLAAQDRVISRKLIIPIGVNQMARDLGLNVTAMDDVAATMRHIDILEKQYDFFMINEYMDESLILLRHRMGLDLKDIVALDVNKRSKKPKNPLETLSEHQRENLRRMNGADHLLYDRFLAKFLKELKAFGTERMTNEVQAYRCLKKAVKEACKFRQLKPQLLPGMFKPSYGRVDGFFPALNSSAPSELHGLCNRLAYSELPHIDLVRAEQFIRVQEECFESKQNSGVEQ